MEQQVYIGEYCSLWDDGGMSFCDGVGYVGSITPKKTRELYEAMRKQFEQPKEDVAA